MEKLGSYWAVVPADVRYDETLRPNAKLLYAELSSLAAGRGYCWPTNQYFAELYGLSVSTVSALISSLEQRGYIRIEMAANESGTERRIYSGAFLVSPCEGGLRKNKKTPPGGSSQKCEEGSSQKCEGHKDNSLNTKTNNPPLSPQGETKPLSDRSKELQAAFAKWLQYKTERRQAYKPTGLDALLSRLRRAADAYGDHAVAELICETMSNNWQGIPFDRLASRAVSRSDAPSVAERSGVPEW